MKQGYKVLLINAGAAVLFTIVAIAVSGGEIRGSDIGFAFGLICLGLGGLNLFIGFIMVLIPEQRSTGTSLLISAAVLLLLSGISCGSSLSGMRL